MMSIREKSVQIKFYNASTYVPNNMTWFFAYYNIKHVTPKTHNPTRQAVIERANNTLEEMLTKLQKRRKPFETY